MTEINSTLALSGVLLFLIGLINGVLIPVGKSPRMGLSAHLTAVQSGTFLMAAGLLWPHIAFGNGWGAPTAAALWLSLYALWLALFLAGVFGTGRDLPIAGGEMRGNKVAQTISTVLLYGSVVGSLGATASMAFWML
ncbi:hypothetical protein ACFCW2_01580 [Qipengyuania sp. DSG2-2]|uniref:hypothetical protein n=1 Tax=Qipengyuania sp. DGS2-2 TaxID=3349631 RepID=UPI0036D22193